MGTFNTVDASLLSYGYVSNNEILKLIKKSATLGKNTLIIPADRILEVEDTIQFLIGLGFDVSESSIIDTRIKNKNKKIEISWWI